MLSGGKCGEKILKKQIQSFYILVSLVSEIPRIPKTCYGKNKIPNRPVQG
jgi:hypothetical protein